MNRFCRLKAWKRFILQLELKKERENYVYVGGGNSGHRGSCVEIM